MNFVHACTTVAFAAASLASIATGQATPVVANYIKASNTGERDNFGHRVALSGDFMAVAALREDSGSASSQLDDSVQNAGAVYIFRRLNGVWAQEAYVKSPHPGVEDGFGYSLALSDGVLAVGALAEDGSSQVVDGPHDDAAPTSGAAYVYRRRVAGSTPEWRLEAYVKAPNAEAGDFFGYSIDIEGDTLAVGAYAESGGIGGVDTPGALLDNSKPWAGAVYTYRYNANGGGPRWRLESHIKPVIADAGDAFGFKVRLDGSLLAVSAVGESSGSSGVGANQLNNSAPQAGAVYIFRRRNSNQAPHWRQTTFVKASNAQAGDQFGWSIDLEDGLLVVGAMREDGSGTGVGNGEQSNGKPDSGAAYVFECRAYSAFTYVHQTAYLKASNSEAGDLFGNEVRIDRNAIVVSAMTEQSSATGVNGDQSLNHYNGAGAAYLFQKNLFFWSQTAYIKATNTYAGTSFGFGCDFDDGVLMIGSPGEHGSSSGLNGPQTIQFPYYAGAVYHYSLVERDCNHNGVADAVDIAAGAQDCDNNHAIDSCEIANGMAGDFDGDGVPDHCQGAGVAFCFGDGSEGNCPCGPEGGLGRGCANPANPAGARLSASGLASISADSLRLQVDGVPPGLQTIMWSAHNQAPAASFGMGFDCLTNNESRLSTGYSTEQGFQVPQPGEGPVHTLGYYGTLPGRYRYYQARYSLGGGGSCTWNTSNAVSVLWIP